MTRHGVRYTNQSTRAQVHPDCPECALALWGEPTRVGRPSPFSSSTRRVASLFGTPSPRPGERRRRHHRLSDDPPQSLPGLQKVRDLLQFVDPQRLGLAPRRFRTSSRRKNASSMDVLRSEVSYPTRTSAIMRTYATDFLKKTASFFRTVNRQSPCVIHQKMPFSYNVQQRVIRRILAPAG
jgi:hypothetical protein